MKSVTLASGYSVVCVGNDEHNSTQGSGSSILFKGQLNAGDYLMFCGLNTGLTISKQSVLIEYINESSNVVNQITNVGTINYTPNQIITDYI